MKREISILTLTMFFFTANIALPFTLHICRMMDMKDTCPNMVPKKVSCCQEENDWEAHITKAYDQCCLSKIIDPSLKENYIGTKTEITKEIESLILNDNLEPSILFNSFENIYSDISPPPKPANTIYLINSNLLI
ncbi:MAG TPA: hypothetical protein VMT35_07500 [Ignavibacteriaceae bacterium]|nr:hypothetical protein [Ignavibacteriaceae bacterium]